MKKSPLSTPSSAGRDFHNNQDRKRGYVCNQIKNDNNLHRISTLNHFSNYFESVMIPLKSSSPLFHSNKGYWRHSNDRRNHHFSRSGISSNCNNQRNSFHSNPGSPYSCKKYQQNYHQKNFKQKFESSWYKKLPISEFIDIKSIFEDPWVTLNKKIINNYKPKNIHDSNDHSIKINLKKEFQNAISESISGAVIVNISSSYEEVKEGSLVDIQLENIHFSHDCKNVVIFSDNISK